MTDETEKEKRLLNLACLGFLCIRLLINVLSVDSLLLKSQLRRGGGGGGVWVQNVKGTEFCQKLYHRVC